ncbi:hypothetical protein ES702_03652 [subsurface metagenome]
MQPDQYQFTQYSYRDPCPTGTSVSAIDSQPDYHITRTPLAESYDQDFDPLSLLTTDTLAGLDLLQSDFPDMNPLHSESAYNSMKPNSSRYPDLTDPDFSTLFSDTHDTPWNGFGSMPQEDNIMPTQHQSYDRSTGKRRKLMSDSGIASSPASAFTSPHSQMRPGMHQNSDYLCPPTAMPSQQDNIDPSYHQEQQQIANSFSARRHTSPSLSQQSPPRSAPKTQRKVLEKHPCDLCKSKSFGTVNDLARHRKGVHGLLELGEKIFRCKVEGCAVASKIWPRRDNFASHLKRMHYNNNEAKTNENVDKFEELYDPDIHGPLDSVKVGKGGSVGQRSKSIQGSSSPAQPARHASMSNTSMAQQTFMSGMTGQGGIIFNQYDGGMASGVSESLASSMMMQQGIQTPSAFAGMGGHASLGVSSQLLQPPYHGSMKRNMGRPGNARTAPPNPDNLSRQKREMRELDQDIQQPPLNGNPLEDLISVGQGLGVGHSGTIDPSILSNTSSQDGTIDLNATSHGSRPDLDPGKALEEMLKKLSPEQRKVLRSLNPEARAEFFNKVEQVDESDQDQGSQRSVTKPSTKKKADGEKTLKCNHWIKEKGDTGKGLVQCSAKFSLQSELNKHRKRHDKRFGCTFDNCYSEFGTKWEWKRHEQSQHIQNEAWRCRQMDGKKSCQELFNDQKKFEEHLIQEHSYKSDTKEMTKEMDECHLLKKWLGSYWCGYCKRVVQSQKDYGKDMDNERVEHIGSHVVEGCRSTDWIELAAGGKTKGEMKEIKDRRSASASHSDEVKLVKQPSHHESEDEDGEDDDDKDGIDGNESGESEDTDSDDSNSRAPLQQTRSKPPTLGKLTTQNGSFPSSSQGSHSGPASSTPTIQGYGPDGERLADHLLENSAKPMQRPRAYSDNNTAGYRNQAQLQHLQAQAQAQMQAQSQSQSQPQHHTPLRYCCHCQRSRWAPDQDKCQYQDCQHQCVPGEYCSYQMSQGDYGLGGFPTTDGSEFTYFGNGV